MIRLKYHPPGTPPGTILDPQSAPDPDALPTKMCLLQYNSEEILECALDSFEELEARFQPGKVNWIDISGLANVDLLQKVAHRFKIHGISLEDVVNTSQRPKAESFSDHYFIISEMVYEDSPNSISVEQVSIFFGKDFVLTIQEEPTKDVFEKVRIRLRNGRGNARRLKEDYLVYAILDATVDQFFPLLEALGDAIEEIEDVLLEKPERSTLRRLYDCKRLLLQLRRAAWPQREIFGTLIRDDTGLISHETQVFLRDCYDHSTQIIDILESYRDLSAGLMDVYLSSLGFRTNEIMRVLTVVSVLFIPLTFLAGVYGMNFELDSPWNMPELKWPFGYLYFWGVCALIVVAMLLFFKRKHWL